MENPFEKIHEEKWDADAVKNQLQSKDFKCITLSNPYQNIRINQQNRTPRLLTANIQIKEHLYNSKIRINPYFNSHVHELIGTVIFSNSQDTTQTRVSWNILSSFDIDVSILDFPIAKVYTLQHNTVKKFLKDFDRVAYNVNLILKSIKEIYHVESFDVI